jgi:hypothetical protein
LGGIGGIAEGIVIGIPIPSGIGIDGDSHAIVALAVILGCNMYLNGYVAVRIRVGVEGVAEWGVVSYSVGDVTVKVPLDGI